MTTSIRGLLVIFLPKSPKSMYAIAKELKLQNEECKFDQGAELTIKCFLLSTKSVRAVVRTKLTE